MNYNQMQPQYTPQQNNDVVRVAPVQNTKKTNLVLVFIITIILSVIVGAGSVLLLLKFKPNFFNNSVTNITKTQREVTVTDSGIADAVEKIYDSVVVVKTYVRNDIVSTGTGFVYKIEDIDKMYDYSTTKNIDVYATAVLPYAIEAKTVGEIQLTDALKELAKEEDMYAYDFIGRRYDVGNKEGFLEATVEFALARDDLKDEFTKYLKSLKRQ